ncbi:MAG: hypothetical protein ACXABY_24055, partial [Candidatus Thorarchaeota archaeon]
MSSIIRATFLVLFLLPSLAFSQWDKRGGASDSTTTVTSFQEEGGVAETGSIKIKEGAQITITKAGKVWTIASTGAATTLNVRDGGVLISGSPTDLDFLGADFVVADATADSVTVSIADAGIDHDATTNFVAGEHFLQSAITVVGTIATGVWNGTPIADAYIPNTITIDLATLATTVTVTDDEATPDAHEVVFTTDNANLESDGTFNYNPSTGTVTATAFAGTVTETNSLEADGAVGIADTEIPIGTGAGTLNYAALSGDATMTNGGVVDIVQSVLEDGGTDEIAVTAGMVNAGTGADATTFFRGDNTWAVPAGGAADSVYKRATIDTLDIPEIAAEPSVLP